MSQPPLALATLLGLAFLAPAAAQDKVVPVWATDTDANESSYFPFLYDKTRVQQIWDAAWVARAGALIQEIRYRRDAQDPQSFAAVTINNLTVELGETPVTPGTMSTAFAANRGSAQTTVFSGTLSLPAQPPVTTVGPWNVAIVLPTPYFYVPGNGNLLMELVVPGQAQQKRTYLLDGYDNSASGTATPFGATGPFANGDQVVYSASGGLAPGSSLFLQADNLTRTYPTVGFIGLSNQSYNGVPLPLDVSPFGAPGNSLYTGLEVEFPMSIVRVGTVIRAIVSTTLPNNPWLGGQTVFSQAYMVDPPSNALGAVFTNAVAITLGGGFGFTQALGASDSNAGTGWLLYGNNAQGGPIVKLVGTIQ